MKKLKVETVIKKGPEEPKIIIKKKVKKIKPEEGDKIKKSALPKLRVR